MMGAAGDPTWIPREAADPRRETSLQTLGAGSLMHGELALNSEHYHEATTGEQ
jgi:hypothetical protein